MKPIDILYCYPNNFRRAIAELPGLVFYCGAGGGLVVNLYAPASARLELAEGVAVEVRQETGYPLTPYNLDPAQWIAWQFDQPEAGTGMVQAFRREKNVEAVQTFRLRGLDPAATYDVTNFDANSPEKITGQELLERGLTIEVKDLPVWL